MLIYSSDRDVICNTQGSDAALSRMEWSGTRVPVPSAGVATKTRNAWNEAGRGLWLYDGCPAGNLHKNIQESHLLTVYNAGHIAERQRAKMTPNQFQLFRHIKPCASCSVLI